MVGKKGRLAKRDQAEAPRKAVFEALVPPDDAQAYPTFDAAADLFGRVERRLDPSHMSAIGYAKFGPGYGLSSHQAAAVAIARRGLKFGERLRSRSALALPVRNRARHVWSDWSRQSQGLRAIWAGGKTPGIGSARGRRPFEGNRGGGIPPSRAAETPPGDGHAVVPGRDPPAQIVGNAVRPAWWACRP